jgi:hypothetical protein
VAVDPQLLTQALRTPEDRDVVDSPIVRAVILVEPENAALLVPALARPDTLEARNARSILCEFEESAVPYLLSALAGTDDAQTRKAGIDVLWTIVGAVDVRSRRTLLEESTAQIVTLLGDRRPVPDTMPAYVERDFRPRICDHLYVIIQELLDPEYDQSSFRGLTDEDRDLAIRRLRLGSGPVA